MNVKEAILKTTAKGAILVGRGVATACLLPVSVYMALNNVADWGWFLFAGLFIYPSQINIEFKEGGENDGG